MADFPRSLIEFQRRFPDERACAAYLARVRWPDGFRCPSCGHGKGWELSTKAFTWECASCRRQTSVTASTVMHASKLPLTVWFWAAYLMATHSNGIAVQLQAQLGLGSYKSAWLLAAKLRRAMVAPGRAPLAGLVEVDETVIPLRRKDEPPASGHGRSHQGKMLVAAGVEVHDGGPDRVRLGAIQDASAESLHAFVGAHVETGATARTDGWSGYPGAPGITHEPHVVGPMAVHVVLPWTHRDRAGGRVDGRRPAWRGDPLDGGGDGQGDRDQRLLGAAHLAQPWSRAAPGPPVQALQRSEVCRQVEGRGRPLRRPAGACGRAVGGRKEPNSGARPHPARPADEERPSDTAWLEPLPVP